MASTCMPASTSNGAPGVTACHSTCPGMRCSMRNMLLSPSRMSRTDAVAYTANGCISRNRSRPSDWSTSAQVRITDVIGESRRPWRGWRQGLDSICLLRSGEAPNRCHARPSALTATWIRILALARKVLWRSRRQLSQLQFHCGNPPPAAAPSTLTSTLDFSRCVGIDFATDGDFLKIRGCPVHASLLWVQVYEVWGSVGRPRKSGRLKYD